MNNYVYDGRFQGNILIVGRTFSGKTYFVQKLTINIFFGELKKPEWISFIRPDQVREAQIQSCFKCNVEFHYPTNTAEFEDIFKNFKVRS